MNPRSMPASTNPRTGADIVLIDPQYAPKVIVKPEVGPMVELIATTAKLENVDLFHASR